MRKLGVLGVLAILAAAPVMAHTTADGCVRFDHMAIGDGSVADAAIAANPMFSETYLYVRGDESDTPLRIVEAGTGRALSVSSGYRIVVDFPPGVVRVAIEGWTTDSLTLAINDEERRASGFHMIPLFEHVLMSYQDGRPARLTFAPRESHGSINILEIGGNEVRISEICITRDTIGLADAALNRPIVSSGPGDEAGGETQRAWKCPEVVGYLKDGKYPERMAREGASIAVMVHMTVNARGLVTDARIEEDDESVFPSIDIAALAVARDCRFDAERGAADTTYRVPIAFDPRRR